MPFSLGEALLIPHLNYTNPIQYLLSNQIEIKGMAHITGGGLLENIPRVLPLHCSVEIDRQAYAVPSIFNIMREIGRLNDNEMYRTFNMGIGLVMIVAANQVSGIQTVLKSYADFPLYHIGQVIEGQQKVVIN